jgi:hypothetical protein
VLLPATLHAALWSRRRHPWRPYPLRLSSASFDAESAQRLSCLDAASIQPRTPGCRRPEPRRPRVEPPPSYLVRRGVSVSSRTVSPQHASTDLSMDLHPVSGQGVGRRIRIDTCITVPPSPSTIGRIGFRGLMQWWSYGLCEQVSTWCIFCDSRFNYVRYEIHNIFVVSWDPAIF